MLNKNILLNQIDEHRISFRIWWNYQPKRSWNIL